jgi:exodeoxyribonuclease VII small subunit
MPADPDQTPQRQTAVGQPANPEQNPSFEAGLAQLGDIVNRLEGGGLGLSESIDAYERGVAMLGRLHAELADAEQRVRVLLGIDEEGRPILQAGVPSQVAQPRTDGPAGGTAKPADDSIPTAPAAIDGAPAERKSGGGRASAARSSEGTAGKSPRSKSLPGMDGP